MQYKTGLLKMAKNVLPGHKLLIPWRNSLPIKTAHAENFEINQINKRGHADQQQRRRLMLFYKLISHFASLWHH